MNTTKATGQCNRGFPTYCPTGRHDYVQREVRIVRIKQGRKVQDFLGEDWVGVQVDDLTRMANALYYYDPVHQYCSQFFLDSKRKTRPTWPLWPILERYLRVLSPTSKARWKFNKWAFKGLDEIDQKTG